MKTDQHLRQLDALEASFLALLKKVDNLQQQLDGVRAENQELRESLNKKDEEIKNFQNRDNIAKIVDSMAAADAGNTAELKWKINEYIREIDKCLAHLKG